MSWCADSAAAPRGVQRTLTITAEPRFPNTPKPEPEEDKVWKNEPREDYPAEMLKHRFMPIGSGSVPPPRVSEPAQAPVASSSGSQPPRVKKEKGVKSEAPMRATTTGQTTIKRKFQMVQQQDEASGPKETPAKKRKTRR